MAKFKVGDKVAYYGKEPAIYRQRGTVSDVSQIRGETFVTVDLDNGEEWGAPEKDWTFMNSCARNAKFKVGDVVSVKREAAEMIDNPALARKRGRVTKVLPGGYYEVDGELGATGLELTDAELILANSCRSTNAVVAKALNACGTARNGESEQREIVEMSINSLKKDLDKVVRGLDETKRWMGKYGDNRIASIDKAKDAVVQAIQQLKY